MTRADVTELLVEIVVDRTLAGKASVTENIIELIILNEPQRGGADKILDTSSVLTAGRGK